MQYVFGKTYLVAVLKKKKSIMSCTIALLARILGNKKIDSRIQAAELKVFRLKKGVTRRDKIGIADI